MIYNNWDGRYRLLDKRLTFPVGLLSTARRILRSHGIRVQIDDQRSPLDYGTPIDLDPKSGFVPRDYQLEMANKAWEAEGGIVRAATGAGKTFVIAMMAARFNVKTVIYVIGIELLYQMKDTIEKAFPGIDVGIVGDGHCEIQDITVATIWSAASAFNQKVQLVDNDHTNDSARKNKKLNKEIVRKMVREAEMIIVDECQYAASNTVQFLHKESVNARHRFLFSGTPWRDSGDDILIEAVGGPKFYDINATRLIKEGWLVQPKIYFLDVPPKRGIGKTYQEVYQNYIVENEDRNNLIVKATKKLIEGKRKALILVTKVDHGKHLLSLLKNELRVSSLDGRNRTADRLQAISDMRKGNLDVLIASKIFDQGIDIPELDSLILAGSGKSSARALQRIGRVIRKGNNKKDAIVVDFYDQCKYLRDHSQARRKVYATEPGFKIIMPKK
jgi:superfamily II DNA or RNA helicase